MKSRIVVSLALAASAWPVSANTLHQNFMTLFEVAVSPKEYDKKDVTIRCAIVNANLGSAQCVVFNPSGQGIGYAVLDLQNVAVETKKRIVSTCTGSTPAKNCVGDISAKVDGRFGPRFTDPVVTWVEVQ
jgi:hypothetical protein